MQSDPPAVPGPAGRLSRRRLFALSALAAATVPLSAARPADATAHPNPRTGATGPTAPVENGPTGDQDDAAYLRAFEEALRRDPEVRQYLVQGREYLYRPRQVLSADADVQRVTSRLRQWGHQVTPTSRFAGVTRLQFSYEVDVPALVTELRNPQQWPGQQPPKVQPHHVFVGFGNIMGNPGSPPEPADPLPPPDPTRRHEGAGVTVGVCDTGIWASAGAFHPAWLGGSYLPELDDVDPLYLYDDVLALQGGHGTFVAGVIRQAAPGIRFDPETALSPTGIGDEASLVAALGRLDSSVSIINLSLGCFTHDDVPPLPVANAVAALPPQVAVVASAGNAGTSRPSWPAALDRVVAVAALQYDGKSYSPAPYSGFGSWVDACAVGHRTSTYVKGELVLPGVPVRNFDGFAAWLGTSFAAAHVSGRLAAIMTATGMDAAGARSLLLSQPRWHPAYGVLVP